MGSPGRTRSFVQGAGLQDRGAKAAMEGSDHEVLQIYPSLIGWARSLQAFSVKKKKIPP